MESSNNEFKVPTLRYVGFNELMYDALNKHENCIWEKLVHCQKQSSILPEQSSILKSIIKEKKKIIRLFNKLMDLTTDKETPCDNCILCQDQMEFAEDRVIAIAKNQPSESEFKKQFQEFQEELAKHCRLQANACSAIAGANKDMVLDHTFSPGMDVTSMVTTIPTTTASAMTNVGESMTIEDFGSIPKNVDNM